VQRLLSHGPTRRAGQDPESIVEAVAHVARSHRAHPGGRQLDSQGETVETAADLDHCFGCLRVVERESGNSLSCALDEQRDRRRLGTTVQCEWWHQPPLLTDDSQAFA
jgi:hypothetical protein